MTQKQRSADDVEVKWAYRPDDRSKQGTTEFLPRDLARQKIREGLAVPAPAAAPDPEDAGEPESAKPARKTAAPARES